MPRPPLLPSTVTWRDTRTELPATGPVPRFPSAARRREYATGRALAAQALAASGSPCLAVGRRGRAPVWPPGYRGSITHCCGYRAAACVSEEYVGGIGIDAELARALPPRIAAAVLDAGERGILDALGVAYAHTIGFSAKETAYKLWNPLTGSWLGPEQARIESALRGDPERGHVVLRVRPGAGAASRMTAWWHLEGGIVRTLAVMARTDRQTRHPDLNPAP